MRIGVFGGTFDPPHIGHVILASEAAFQLQLQRVLWVLTPDPPHKQGRPVTPADLRLEMVQAAIGEDSQFELSRVDLDRPSPHYAVDTLYLLAQAYPDTELAYLLGGDSLHDLPTWYHPLELLDACAVLGVMQRPGIELDLADLEKKLPGISKKVTFIFTSLIDVSSSQIRQRVAAGQPYRHFICRPVYHCILDHNLYR